MEKIQEEQLRKMLVEQREQIEKLQQENTVLAKAVKGCSRSVDSILAVVTEQYGTADFFGGVLMSPITLTLPEDKIKNALNLWEVTTKRAGNSLLVSIRRRE